MKAKLIKFYSVEVNQNLSEYKPKEYDNFGFCATFTVGEPGTEGSDNFEIIICTPKWLTLKYSKSDIVFGRHYLIVFEYNYNNILNELNKYIEELTADSWEELGEKIGRIGQWEFEDYHE